jgi:hypothetical protein
MSSLLDTLMKQLGGDAMGQISSQIGTDERKTGAATGTAISALLGALSRNASKGDGAQALHRALEKDHDGSLLEQLGGFLNDPQAGPGDGILKHVLGARRQQVERGIGQSTGLDAGSVGKLLTMLAPIVMGALGKEQRRGGLDAGALSGLLGQERQELERREPEGMGLLGTLLDADGDGDFDMGDMAKRGAGLLGKLFSK